MCSFYSSNNRRFNIGVISNGVTALDGADADPGPTELLAVTVQVYVPLNRVLTRIRDTREQRYSLLRGYFHGATDTAEDAEHAAQKLLHSVPITPGAAAIGKTLGELELARFGVEVKTVRRHDVHARAPQFEARLEAGDVLVLLGSEQDCAAAEMKLLQG
jgi:monovalent cation:H+ antiporter-2, CPA2 family